MYTAKAYPPPTLAPISEGGNLIKTENVTSDQLDRETCICVWLNTLTPDVVGGVHLRQTNPGTMCVCGSHRHTNVQSIYCISVCNRHKCGNRVCEINCTEGVCLRLALVKVQYRIDVVMYVCVHLHFWNTYIYQNYLGIYVYICKIRNSKELEQ